MHTVFKLLLGSVLTFTTAAVNSVEAQMNVTPVVPSVFPPGTVLSDLQDILNVQVVNAQNTDFGEVSFRFQINSENGFAISTNVRNPQEVFTVVAFESRIFTGIELSSYFQPENIIFRTDAIKQQALVTGLPAGTYQLCYQAYLDNTRILSGEPPQGCISFTVQPRTIMVSAQALPPFRSEYDSYDWASRIRVTLMPNFGGQVSLELQLTGDNGVIIHSADTYKPVNIDVEANFPVVLNPAEIEPYLMQSILQLNGIGLMELEENGLPAGRYQWCVRVFDDGNELVSATTGCTNEFDILESPLFSSLIDPPMPVSPVCGKNITDLTNQVIVFSWTPPPGPQIFTNYILKVVEIADNQMTPTMAMLTATEPAFFETEVSGVTTFLYGPAHPVLEKGRRYAWQVIASDDTGRGKFANDGKSEVCWFEWNPGIPGQDGNDFQLTMLSPTSTEDTLVVNDQKDLYLSWGWLYQGAIVDLVSNPGFASKDIHGYRMTIRPGKSKTGHMIDPSFEFKSEISSDSGKDWIIGYFQRSIEELTASKLKDGYWYKVDVEAMNSKQEVVAWTGSEDFILLFDTNIKGPVTKVSGQLMYQFEDQLTHYPVPGTALRFEEISQAAGSFSDQQAYYTETDPEGIFSIDLPTPPSGTKKYAVKIESPYYHSPDTILEINTDTNLMQLGQIVTDAYNYTLKLVVIKTFGEYKIAQSKQIMGDDGLLKTVVDTVQVGKLDESIHEVPIGITIRLYRKIKPDYLPPYEGEAGNSTATTGMILVGEGKTAVEINEQGEKLAVVNFDKLLCNVFSDDIYYLKAVDPEQTDINGNPSPYKEGQFTASEQELRFKRPVNSGDSTHFDVIRTYALISTKPPTSTISGQLMYSWPGDPGHMLRPLANMSFSVVVEYLFNDKVVEFNKWVPNGNIHTTLQLDSDKDPTYTDDYAAIMATGETDGNGYFVIQAVNLNTKGVLGSGTETQSGGSTKLPVQIPAGVADMKDLIISPTDPAGFLYLGELTFSSKAGVFNFSDMDATFDAQLQSNLVNASMNGGLAVNQGVITTSLGQAHNDHDESRLAGVIQGVTSPEDYSGSHGPSAVDIPFRNLDRALSEGIIKRVYRIQINDPGYYYNPETNIVVDPLKSIDTGPIEVKVKEVNWHVTAVDQNNMVLGGLKAVVFRDPMKKVSSLPQDEGDGEYRMKALINPQFGGELIPPSTKSTKGKTGAIMQNNWNDNQMYYTSPGLSTGQVLGDAATWSTNAVEWLEEGETDAAGKVSFGQLVSGFGHYFIEVVSNPTTGHNAFYAPNISNINALTYGLDYDQDISPLTNAIYGDYWDLRQRDIPEAQLTVVMKNLPGRAGGRVLDKAASLGIKNAVVKLYDTNDKVIKSLVSDADGYFEFLHVFDLLKKKKDVTVRMRAFVPGYVQVKGPEGQDYREGLVKEGSQYIDDILMQPSATITGYVKNEQDEAVDAWIKRVDGVTVRTFGFGPGLFLKSSAGKFSIPYPAGQLPEDKLIIIPKDPGYFSDTVLLSNLKEGKNDIGVHTVFRRKHRIQLVVTGVGSNAMKVPLARITINKNQTVLTDVNGEAEFEFENVSVNNYTLAIEGPDGAGYIPQVINLKNGETKKTVTYWIKLKKGGHISGITRINGQPVGGVKVYLDYQQTNTSQPGSNYQLNESLFNSNAPPVSAGNLVTGTTNQIVTYSDASGYYNLHGIPTMNGSVNLIATLDTTFTVIGDKQTVTLNAGEASQDLTLTRFDDMFIGSIYGFPLSIESISPTKDENVFQVTGLVDLEQSDTPFRWISDEKSIRIRNVLFSKKNVNGEVIGVATDDQTVLEAITSLKLEYLEKYNLQVTQEINGTVAELKLKRGGNGKGQLSGYTRIVDNSFNYPSSYLNFKDKEQFYLATKENKKWVNEITVLTAVKSNSTGAKQSSPEYHLSNNVGAAIHFQFISFNAIASPENSYIDLEGRIHLDLSMSCHIPNAKPENFSVHAGDIILDNSKVYPAPGAEPLTLEFEEWKLEISDWAIDPEKGGIYSKNGLIKTTRLEIPFREFNLRSDLFVMDDFQVDKLQLGGGVATLSGISMENALLVFDPKSGSDMSGHWKLAVAGTGNKPAATLENLSPYLDNAINIQYIQLLSNGEDIFSIQQTGNPYSINENKVTHFSPSGISSNAGFFTITGGLKIPAPRLIPVQLNLTFTGSPSSLKMEVKPVDMSFEGQGYVEFVADETISPVITSNQVVIKGLVEEKDRINPIPATFYANGNDPVTSFYHVDLQKEFVLALTEKSTANSPSMGFNLKIDKGGMHVPQGGNDWTLLVFSGNMVTSDKTFKADGADPDKNRMTFTVDGEIDVTGDHMSVSHVETPFGEMKMIYDFPKKQMYGTVKVEEKDIGSFKATGTVEILLDPKGWYFLGACEVSTPVPGPFKNLNMGFLLGNRTYYGAEADIVKNKVGQYSYDKSSLCWLNKDGGAEINGFFITAGKKLIDKEIGVNLKVAKIELLALAGVEASLYANFSDWTALMSAGVYGKISAGASIPAVSISASAGVHGTMTGMMSASDVCIGGEMGASVTGSGTIGEGPLKTSFDFSVDAMVGIRFSTQNGTDTDFDFGSAPTADCDSKSNCGNIK